ncbi:hypothetical protein LX99_04430 [Mucilaginibacter oryzae]|uniref:Uncharacterized protein n=1 Tax=Mucilaginibacter oryzae TaxID=468058 RepID=A0A316H586_9SPHI|nr:hypothetical protein [Mucilaginibacter oryzae]PWK71407.1 hypothetical protein LX99_04430 [Mucilaginibacter oryzae]
MKNLKLHHFLIMLCFFITSCATTTYLGDAYPATEKVDVYYDARDVKKDYKVTGHLVTDYTYNPAKAKEELIAKAKKAGADGIIILLGAAGNHIAIRADALKYNR